MYFLHQIKRTNGNYDKGIVVKETMDSAEQGFHAYLGAYAYGNNVQTDFVSVRITDDTGLSLEDKCWAKVISEEAE